MLERLAVFGAGDLTRRYLLPALLELESDRRLPPAFNVVAAGPEPLDTPSFRSAASSALAEHAPAAPADRCQRLLDRLSYVRADVTDAGDVARVLAQEPDLRPLAVYLAVPPEVFDAGVDALQTAGLPPGSRLAVEKPFGTDLGSARALNERIRRFLPEQAVFRVDHFLGIQTVQNLVGLRFANRVFEPIWNNHHVERVEIVWEETVTLEGRGYYDHVGALRDMVQNHLLQLLALVAMEPPGGAGEQELRDRKSDVLRAVRRVTPQEVAERTVRARYTAGRVGGRHVPAYTDESLVDPQRQTETFAQVTLAVDTWRWSGVPFVLRTGKALGTDRREVVLRFRPVPPHLFPRAPAPNVLRIPLDPEVLSLHIALTAGGDSGELQPAVLRHRFPEPELPAYARVLLAVLEGDPTLSIRADEAEASWEVVTPILRGWEEDLVPLDTYPAGSSGPRTVEPAVDRTPP